MLTLVVLTLLCLYPAYEVVVNCGNVQGIAVNNTLMLGYLLPWEKEWLPSQKIGSAIVIGIEEVYKRQLLPGYKVDFTSPKDTYCNANRGKG